MLGSVVPGVMSWTALDIHDFCGRAVGGSRRMMYRMRRGYRLPRLVRRMPARQKAVYRTCRRAAKQLSGHGVVAPAVQLQNVGWF